MADTNGFNPPTKYILQTHKGRGEQEGILVVVCARADSGLILGAIQNNEMWWGIDPQNVERRSYLTGEQALAALKVGARNYAGREDVEFIYEDAEPRILVPGGRRRM